MLMQICKQVYNQMQICKIDVNMQTWYLKIKKHMHNKYRYMPYQIQDDRKQDQIEDRTKYKIELKDKIFMNQINYDDFVNIQLYYIIDKL